MEKQDSVVADSGNNILLSRWYHGAEGAVDTACKTIFIGALGTMTATMAFGGCAIVSQLTSIGVVDLAKIRDPLETCIMNAASFGVGSVGVALASVVAGQSLEKASIKALFNKNGLSKKEQDFYRRTGSALLLSFALVCGVVPGKIFHDNLNHRREERNNSRVAVATAAKPLKQDLSGADLQGKECKIVCNKEGDTKVISGPLPQRTL